MALPTILAPDQTAVIGAKNTYNTNVTKPGAFDKFLSTASYTAQTFGPLAYASTNAATGNINGTSSQIVGAAINATASQNTSYGGMPSFATTSMGSSPSYTGTTSIGITGSAGSSGMTGLSSNVESILSDTAASQAYLLGIQMQMGEQQTMFTSVSNAINVRDSMKKQVINNFKV